MTTLHDLHHKVEPTQAYSHNETPTSSGRRPTINITPNERIGRAAMGLIAIIAGALLVSGAGSVLAVVLEVLLIAAGVDLAVTGALGHCPLYSKLGYVPRSLRRSS